MPGIVDFFLTQLPKLEDIHCRINSRYDGLTCEKDDGSRVPFVCVLCDEFILSTKNKNNLTVERMKKLSPLFRWNQVADGRRTSELEAYYSWNGDKNGCTKNLDFLQGLALSPRATLERKTGRGSSGYFFKCCQRCYNNTVGKNAFIPRHAILNKNYIGGAPECLRCLTEVERAFLTPIKNFGFCFTWRGGQKNQMNGTLSFMRVKRSAIANGVATLNELGLNENVICLFAGNLTAAQKRRADQQSKIRVDKVTDALHWLVANNVRWSDVDMANITEKLQSQQPVIVDRSQEVESENANIENIETFTVYYPEGANTNTHGGFEKAEDFKSFVKDMATAGFDPEFEFNVEKQFFKGSDSDLLVDTCLLQFPYGIGGMEERRVLKDGSFDERSNMEEYLEHLSRKSDPEFQTPLFQLVMYSMVSKSRLLRSSTLQLRGKTDAKNLVEGLNRNDVISAINGRRMKNRYAGTDVSKKFLDAVDATGKALPHTNESARQAKGKAESTQHHFGMASVFATVTFDDENSFLMQVLAGSEIDDDTPVENLSDHEVSRRARLRRELRLKYPGIAAMNFEMQLEILLKEVVGWDTEKNEATGEPGFFGIPEAVIYSVEEQGRNTLHVHLLIYIKGYSELKEAYFFAARKADRDAAEIVLRKYNEHCASTSLFPTKTREIIKAFDHECIVPQRNRRCPVVVDDQGLRDLRNKQGYKDSGGLFATCPECLKKWTYEEMVGDFLVNSHNLKQPEEYGTPVQDVSPVIPKARCLAECVAFQKQKHAMSPPVVCMNAAYQHHTSCHVNSCFRCKKKGSKKRGHVCGPQCECRYRMPDRKRTKSEVYVDTDKVTWYTWRGLTHEQPLAQIVPKRQQYDLFQNVSCNAVSHSKFSCNSNVATILDGPVGQCSMKYTFKENQKEEEADYYKVEQDIKKMHGDRRVHESDRAEALRLITRAAFAQNRSNVVSAPFASFFLRNPSRFYFSHQFIFCPLRDIVRLHNNQEIRGVLRFQSSKAGDDSNAFFENLALNYLCRHEDTEACSLREIFECYDNRNVPKENDDQEVLPYQSDTGHFQHPSVAKTGFNKGRCSKGLKKKEVPGLIQVSQWMFPDTAEFRADLLTCSEAQMNKAMESYSELILCLLLPHRCKSDLLSTKSGTFPFTHKVQEVYAADQERKLHGQKPVMFSARNEAFLQNLQNSRSNTLRYKISEDDLSRRTNPYDCPNSEKNEEEDDEEEEEPDDTAYEAFAQMLEDQQHNTIMDEDPSFLPQILKGFNFNHMKNKGKRACGYKDDIPTPPLVPIEGGSFLRTDVRANTVTDNVDGFGDIPDNRPTYSVGDIVRLHMQRNLPKVSKTVWEDKEIEVSDATGSVYSIRQWAKAAFGGDEDQSRAFEVITACFLLTFYEETPENAADPATATGNERSNYRRMKLALLKLRGAKKHANLICLLHGPGGSGKSTVINLVKAYAKDYCAMLGHPYTERTIVVTAMSGVAATLLNGETTHSVLGFKRDNVQEEEVQAFVDARLLIVDEISFAAEEDFEAMHEKLKKLMQNHYRLYGGLNIVFAGDYSQLEPVKRDPIYKGDKSVPLFHGALNCYIELRGNWRFKDDPDYGDVMQRFRAGNPTIQDVDKINERVNKSELPVGIQVATYTNANRDAVNAAIFDDYTYTHGLFKEGNVLNEAVVVLMDELMMNNSGKVHVPVTSNGVKKWLYENVSESCCKVGDGRGRVDPVLKLYPDAPMMFTQNTDVSNGEANGSRVKVKGVRAKPGETPFPLKLDNGTTVQAIFASQVEAIVLEHENKDISPRQFETTMQSWTFTAKVNLNETPEVLKMKGNQFPIVSNSCTTGHKLQGCSVDSILVNDWCYTSNWAYVVLSRVKTLNGLFLREELSDDLTKYDKPEAMKRMLQNFATSDFAVKYLSDEEYSSLENTGHYLPTLPSTFATDAEINF